MFRTETHAPVMILGESGSGKEVLARTLHANGARRDRPFVAVNVAALPSELLESELSGHAKGAFTGAAIAKRGLFEAADTGTLLLDEIAEMPPPLQAKLLRALQGGEIRRVGDTRAFSGRARPLRDQPGPARVRERAPVPRGPLLPLRVFTLTVPPLRQRLDDIVPLATMFLEEHGHPTQRFTPDAARALQQHKWPGNIRELANSMHHAAVLSGGREIDVTHLPDEVVRPPRRAPRKDALRSLAEVEREHVLRVMEACGGSQIDAARVLGIGRTTLWRKLRALGVDSTE
jgi:DNA-binding NtrC family response regulator